MSITVQSAALIKIEGKRAHGTWCAHTKTVTFNGEDVVFVQLDKWDRGFVKFVTGKPLTWQSESGAGDANNVNCKFLDTMQQLRTRAANKAFSDAIAAHEDDDDNPKKPKQRKANRDDEAVVDDQVLTLQLPELVGDAGRVLANSVTLKVLWGVKNDVVWVELKEDNLNYIRHGIVQSLARGEVGRHWSGK
jgi:hypothetical protein